MLNGGSYFFMETARACEWKYALRYKDLTATLRYMTCLEREGHLLYIVHLYHVLSGGTQGLYCNKALS